MTTYYKKDYFQDLDLLEQKGMNRKEAHDFIFRLVDVTEVIEWE